LLLLRCLANNESVLLRLHNILVQTLHNDFRKNVCWRESIHCNKLATMHVIWVEIALIEWSFSQLPVKFIRSENWLKRHLLHTKIDIPIRKALSPSCNLCFDLFAVAMVSTQTHCSKRFPNRCKNKTFPLKDCGCVELHEIDFLLKTLLIDSTASPLRRLITCAKHAIYLATCVICNQPCVDQTENKFPRDCQRTEVLGTNQIRMTATKWPYRDAISVSWHLQYTTFLWLLHCYFCRTVRFWLSG